MSRWSVTILQMLRTVLCIVVLMTDSRDWLPVEAAINLSLEHDLENSTRQVSRNLAMHVGRLRLEQTGVALRVAAQVLRRAIGVDHVSTWLIFTGVLRPG